MRIFFVLALCVVFSAEAVLAEELKFVRLSRSKTGVVQALEVANTKLASPDGKLKLDLVGAVHVGDKKYYDELNKLLSTYDKVFYELVISEDGVDPKVQLENSGDIYGALFSRFGFASQLSVIDYSPKSFIHADLSSSELAKEIEAGSQTYSGIVFSVLQASMASSNQAGAKEISLKLLLGLFSPNRELVLKRAVAEQLVLVGVSGESLGRELNELLIEKRNERALEVIRGGLKKGKKGKMAVFYGAAHMGDFVERLERELGLKVVGQDWLVGWGLGANKSL